MEAFLGVQNGSAKGFCSTESGTDSWSLFHSGMIRLESCWTVEKCFASELLNKQHESMKPSPRRRNSCKIRSRRPFFLHWVSFDGWATHKNHRFAIGKNTRTWCIDALCLRLSTAPTQACQDRSPLDHRRTWAPWLAPWLAWWTFLESFPSFLPHAVVKGRIGFIGRLFILDNTWERQRKRVSGLKYVRDLGLLRDLKVAKYNVFDAMFWDARAWNQLSAGTLLLVSCFRSHHIFKPKNLFPDLSAVKQHGRKRIWSLLPWVKWLVKNWTELRTKSGPIQEAGGTNISRNASCRFHSKCNKKAYFCAS